MSEQDYILYVRIKLVRVLPENMNKATIYFYFFTIFVLTCFFPEEEHCFASKHF